MTKQEYTCIEQLAKSIGLSIKEVNELLEVFRESCKDINHVSEILGSVQVIKDTGKAILKSRKVIPTNFYKNKTK